MSNDGVTSAFDLMLDEIESVVSDVNSEAAACIRNSEYQKARSKIEAGEKLAAFRAKLEALKQEWISGWDEPTRKQISVETSAVARTIAFGAKASKTVLVVKFRDGTVIYDNIAADSFTKAIQKLGLNRVENLNLKVNNFPLVSKLESENYNQSSVGEYFIMTHTSTEAKRSLLLRIADALRDTITVDVVPGQVG